MRRAAGCWLFLLPVLLSGACVSAVVAAPPPALERDGARVLLIEADAARRLVQWTHAGSGGEGVLEVLGDQRVSLVAPPARSWTRIVRQSWAALGHIRRRWTLVSSVDLPPDQWWNG